jgi:hypothetical protein
VPDEDLGSLLRRAIATRNFFTGINPLALLARLREAPGVKPEGIRGPWRWHATHARAYLVVGW